MYAEWDNAHTDHTTTPTRPEPASLTRTEADWRAYLEHETPNGWLLRGNAMTETLVSGRPIHLMHTTVALDAIRASGHLYASTGCLVAALYCAPLTPEPAGLRPHNLGSYLLETKKHTRTLVFEITPDVPAPPKGIDYLRLGAIHLRTYLTHRSFLTEHEDTQLRQTVMRRIQSAAPFLDTVLANATGTPTPDADFIDQLAATVPAFPFLGYLYFEVLSEYLMLHSTSHETKAYAQLGEMNNHLYKQLAFSAVQGMDKLFDLSRFNPGHNRLLELIGQIETGLTAGTTWYVRERLAHLFATVALAPDRDAESFTFHHSDFDGLTNAAPGLLGQLLFRELRVINRYPQLYLAFEQAKALEAWSYRNAAGIPTPFNGTVPKGEIGINPTYPRANCTAWTAETCERGLLHPAEQLDVEFLPRLAELSMTAMRRDETGTAAGHRR